MKIMPQHTALRAAIGDSFSLAPFSTEFQPVIEATLAEYGLDKWRKGTVLLPTLLLWLVLALTVRRDLNCRQVLNWVLSGLRWLNLQLPPKAQIVQEGAISHARVKLGVPVFQTLLQRQSATAPQLAPDFHGWLTVAFDGSTATMPDTAVNTAAFGKPTARRGSAAFPQVRLMVLLAVSARWLLDVAAAPYRGKGTGERALLRELLARVTRRGLLFLLDAGLYDFGLLWEFEHREHAFIIKAPRHVKLTPRHTLPDGSYLADIQKRLPDPDAPPKANGQPQTVMRTLTVRVIRLQIPGFRPITLVTNVLDSHITARELACHYHQRWDVEIAYDEIKTHQCVTLRGQAPTTFRSKRPDLVRQELFALVIMYNLVRRLMHQAATAHDQDPRQLSFLDALHQLIEATPVLPARPSAARQTYLLAVLADCKLDRPRRPRVAPRVVKVKTSKFKRKRAHHHTENRDLEAEMQFLPCPKIMQDSLVESGV